MQHLATAPWLTQYETLYNRAEAWTPLPNGRKARLRICLNMFKNVEGCACHIPC